MTTLSSELVGALLAAIASLIAIAIGRKKGFFQFPILSKSQQNPPTLLLVLIAFAIYLISMWVTPHFFIRSIHQISSYSEQIKIAVIANVSIYLVLISLLAIYLFSIAKPIRQTILLQSRLFEPKKDLIAAAAAWVISFPAVLFIGTLSEILLYFITGTFEIPDQVAVLFLKRTMDFPSYFVMALVMIVIFAPLIEETLFRGFFQSWLRRYLSPTLSILIASVFFTAFHFSIDQKMANVPILASLFVLSCMIGFLYEKRQSLFAPIVLHALFNALNAANLYFLSIS